jgi:hypothetical protein
MRREFCSQRREEEHVPESGQVRAISNEEGNRLLRIVRRGSGSVVTWRRADGVAVCTGDGKQATAPQLATTWAELHPGSRLLGHPDRVERRALTSGSRSLSCYANMTSQPSTPSASIAKQIKTCLNA